MSLYTDFDHTNPPLGDDGTPYDFFKALRDEAEETKTPLGWSEQHGGFWVATGYDVNRQIYHDPARFSNKGVTFPAYQLDEGSALMLAGQDAPAHKKYRKLVQGPFSPKLSATFNEPLKEMTHALIDDFIEAGEVDVVKMLADAVPSRMTAVILGLNHEDGDLFRKWCWAMTHLFLTDPKQAGEDLAEMDAYFKEVLAHRKKNLGDDVLSLVIQSEVDGEAMSDQEIKDFFIVLLLGGIENTSKLLSTMIWHLSWDKQLRARMAGMDGTDTLLAMDEFLRYYPPAYLGRLILEDVEIDGVKMEAGQHVLLHQQTANRDRSVFEDPDVLHLDRSPNRHLGLGLGVHRCLGAHLVRNEGQIVAEAFLSRIPEFELDTTKPPSWIPGQVSGMANVHLKFPAGKRLDGAALAGVS